MNFSLLGPFFVYFNILILDAELAEMTFFGLSEEIYINSPPNKPHCKKDIPIGHQKHERYESIRIVNHHNL